MRIEKVLCDYCTLEIPHEKKKDIFGIEREFYKFGKIKISDSMKNIYPQRLGLELCESCADRISNELENYRFKLIFESEKREVKEREKRNAERRKTCEKDYD